MLETPVIYPGYFRIVERVAPRWHFQLEEVFVNFSNAPSDPNGAYDRYGITSKQVSIELFRINAGRNGFYLVNLRDKKYYYCGLDLKSVKLKLRELNIGMADPLDKFH